MSAFQDDSDGENLTKDLQDIDTDAIELFLEDIYTEVEGLISGVLIEHEENKEESLLSSSIGQVAFSYLQVWQTAIEQDEGMLDEKTTLAELLLFIATVQAEMDLLTQGNSVQ